MADEFATIQAFLEKFNPKDEEAQKALGVTERQGELFWAALNAVTEESGLAIPNFNTLAAKINKFPGAYINELKKKGLIKRGKKRGNWSLTAEVVKKIASLLSGEAVPEEVPAKEKKIRRRDGSERLPKKMARTTVGQLVNRLKNRIVELRSQMAQLEIEKTAVEARLKAIMDALI